MKILITTAVWGKWHIDALLRVCVPTLLAPGNMPELARRHDVIYRIDIRASEKNRFDHPAIEALRRHIRVEIIPVLPETQSENIFEVQHGRWLDATACAARDGMYVWTLSPDIALADGALRFIADELDQGRKSITWTWCRVVDSTFVVDLLADAGRTGDGPALPIPPRRMVALALRHLHPVMAAYLPESLFFPHHPEIMVWPVRDEGLAVRVVASVNFIYDPSALKLTRMNLCEQRISPELIAYAVDSDQVFGVSLAPVGKDISWHLVPRAPAPIEIARWQLGFDSPMNDWLMTRRIRWHIGDCTEELWRATEAEADDFIAQTAHDQEWLRLWRSARDAGCFDFARIMAAGLELGILPPLEGACVLLMPKGSFLDGVDNPALKALLSDQELFTRWMRRYVLSSRESFMNWLGTHASEYAPGENSALNLVPCGKHFLYTLESPLHPDPVLRIT